MWLCISLCQRRVIQALQLHLALFWWRCWDLGRPQSGIYEPWASGLLPPGHFLVPLPWGTGQPSGPRAATTARSHSTHTGRCFTSWLQSRIWWHPQAGWWDESLLVAVLFMLLMPSRNRTSPKPGVPSAPLKKKKGRVWISFLWVNGRGYKLFSQLILSAADTRQTMAGGSIAVKHTPYM